MSNAIFVCQVCRRHVRRARIHEGKFFCDPADRDCYKKWLSKTVKRTDEEDLDFVIGPSTD